MLETQRQMNEAREHVRKLIANPSDRDAWRMFVRVVPDEASWMIRRFDDLDLEDRLLAIASHFLNRRTVDAVRWYCRRVADENDFPAAHYLRMLMLDRTGHHSEDPAQWAKRKSAMIKRSAKKARKAGIIDAVLQARHVETSVERDQILTQAIERNDHEAMQYYGRVLIKDGRMQQGADLIKKALYLGSPREDHHISGVPDNVLGSLGTWYPRPWIQRWVWCGIDEEMKTVLMAANREGTMFSVLPKDIVLMLLGWICTLPHTTDEQRWPYGRGW